MKKKQRLDFYREIRKSITRFLSIMLIVALGVAFFAGVRSAEPDMKISIDEYYDKTNFYDIRLAGTIGFTEDDIAAVSAVEGVEKAEGMYYAEMYYKTEEKNCVLTLNSLTESISNVTLTEGRLPENETECVLDADFAAKYGLTVGSKMSFTAEAGKQVEESLINNDFTVTGLLISANFLTEDRGTSSIGIGKSDGYVYLTKSAFCLPVYSQCFVKVLDAERLRSYSKEYENKINAVKERIGNISGDRCAIRIEEYKAAANENLNYLTAVYNEQRAAAEAMFTAALTQIQDGEVALTNARIAIRKAKESNAQLEPTIPALQATADEYGKKLDDKVAEVNALIEKWPALQQKLAEVTNELNVAQANYDASPTPENQAALDEAKQSVNIANGDISYATRTITDGIAIALDAYNEKLAALNETQGKIDANNASLEQNTALIAATEEQVKVARQTYNAQKLESDTALNDAYAKIELATKAVNALDGATWYILDRNSVQNYVEFLSDAQKVGALGTIFPIIFFVVAALISLTTMTRMVEEQRVQIGTLKALGYSKGSVASKYILYALFASLIGSIIGAGLGSQILPKVIIGAYKNLYIDLISTVTPLNISNSLIATLVAVACTTGATIFACYKVLNEQAASLMRPVSPKYGKVILLERVAFIWKRLSFGRKSAIRNIVRYKKRFFMTLFGIAGCMGLLMVGFGIRDSIATIVDRQYENIWIYDATMNISEKISSLDRDIFELELLSNENVNDILLSQVKSVDVTNGKTEKSIYIFVPETTKNFERFIILKDRKSKTHYTLSGDGVIITEKLSKQLGVGVGGKISIKDENKVVGEVTVTGVVENYIYNYMYMSPEFYNAFYGKAPQFNDIYITLHNDSKDARDKFASKYAGDDKVVSLSFVNEMQTKIANMMKSLDFVVFVLIISAGLLAIIVLYNLVNINITERSRELATIKLLGFYDLELAQYVYRENIILTALGTLLGVVLGLFLHKFLIDTTEIDMIMFGRQISIQSYFFSIALTVVFAFLVNLWMYFKLKKIDMVESLKSVE